MEVTNAIMEDIFTVLKYIVEFNAFHFKIVL